MEVSVNEMRNAFTALGLIALYAISFVVVCIYAGKFGGYLASLL